MTNRITASINTTKVIAVTVNTANLDKLIGSNTKKQEV